MILPKAKTENIVVQDLGGELLVYNLTTHQAFTLNETLKIVYEACDGQTSFADLKRKHQFTDDLIYLALDELSDQDLLKSEYNSPFAGVSRRKAIKTVGLASIIALPMIAGIIAPVAVHAASEGCTNGQSAADPDGRRGRGEICGCSPDGTGSSGYRPCNTTRGGDGRISVLGCKMGCICRKDAVSQCNGDCGVCG